MLVVPLESMATGEQGRIHALDGSPEFVVRLQEMGLREGVPVQMVRAGSPCILSVNDQRLSLRFEDSTTVLVELTK
jgi:ferrous iron transport protein A